MRTTALVAPATQSVCAEDLLVQASLAPKLVEACMGAHDLCELLLELGYGSESSVALPGEFDSVFQKLKEALKLVEEK